MNQRPNPISNTRWKIRLTNQAGAPSTTSEMVRLRISSRSTDGSSVVGSWQDGDLAGCLFATQGECGTACGNSDGLVMGGVVTLDELASGDESMRCGIGGNGAFPSKRADLA